MTTTAAPSSPPSPTHTAGSDHESPLRQVRRNLAHLVEYAPLLAESKLPGTPLPWVAPLLSDEARDEQAARDRLERDERERDNRGRGVVMGFTRAPGRVDVLDLLVEINMTANDLIEGLAGYVPTVLPAVWSVFQDPRILLGEVDRLLPIADEMSEDPTWWAARKIRQLSDQVDRALRLIRPGTTLEALCPFCGGVDARHPAGGRLTLRVEQVAKPRAKTATRPKVEEAWAVVCHGESCTPPEDKCGTWFRGHPAWPQSEWDWLAKQLLDTSPSAPDGHPDPHGVVADGATHDGWRYDALRRWWIDEVAEQVAFGSSPTGRYLAEQWAAWANGDETVEHHVARPVRSVPPPALRPATTAAAGLRIQYANTTPNTAPVALGRSGRCERCDLATSSCTCPGGPR